MKVGRIFDIKTKYFSYIFCMVLVSVSFANSDSTINEKSLKKILTYSFVIGLMNSSNHENHDSNPCIIAERVMANQNEIIKNTDSQSYDTAQDMIKIARITNKNCNSRI